MSEQQPRILIEGGTVDRRVKYMLAAMVGFFIGGAIAFILILASVHGQGRRLTRDENATCVIQARGLPASKHLAHVMVDIELLLRPTAGEAKTPPPPPPVAKTLASLRMELAAYNKIEAMQPASRKC